MIQQDLQSLAPGSIVDMYEVDTGAYGLGILRYCAHVNELGTDIIWQGEVYNRFPVKVEGYKRNSQGTLARPTMTLANISGVLSPMLKLYNSFLGSKVTRKRTLAKYLDAVNFVGGVNTSADPNSHFEDEIYFVDRKAGENAESITLELSVAWDVTGVKIPLRQVIRDICQYEYRGPDCGYIGPAVAKIDNTPTTLLSEDRCSKGMVGCKLRFGSNSQLPASFFPAVGLIR